MSLDTVCKAILGEGKYRELDGVEIQKMTKEEQLKYVSQDAGLVMKLSQHDNFKLLDLMNAISQIISITFDKVCHTEVSSWWTKMIEGMVISGKDRFARTVLPKKKYTGGYVLKPKIGFYDKKPIYVLDVKSLYPSMMIAHNISFETVSCKCCENDPEAKVGEKIMISINDNLPEQEKRNDYWICRNPKYRGIVARLLEQFRDERFRQQDLGNELIQLALKNLINSCYGLFGTDFFPFRDYRVAELTTAFGREALQYMQHIAKEVFGFELIYGDTDSIFITNVKNEIDVKKFITECYIMFDIDVEISKIYRKFLITKKKHYIGINLENNREIDIKGMKGIKSDRPPWLNKIESQLANDIKDGKDPTVNIRKQYIAMESGQVPLPDLEIRLTLAKNPEKYQQNSLQRVVGTELASSQGDVINYYKSGVMGGGTSNIGLINRRKYLEMLKTTMEDSLKLMGYDYIRDVVGFKSLQDYPRQVPENLCTLPSLMQANQLQSSSRYDTNDSKNAFDFDIRSLIRCQTIKQNGYTYIPCTPAQGVLYITNDNPDFISGQVRMRGKDEGRYPYKYLEMIDAVFGSEYNTIEVCSRSIPGINQRGSCFTIDINSECSPDLVTDGQVLQEIPDNKFNRWRCDPPYNENTARKMYGTSLPKTSRLLQAGARVCKPGSLMFLLLGPTNYQPCSPGVKRIGFVPISIIPNNEFRVLNIFLKLK